MAFKVSSDAQLVFFNSIFGLSHQVTTKVKALVQVGVTFEIALLAIRAFANPAKTQPLGSVKLTIGTTALLKTQNVPPTVYTHNVKLIREWVEKLYDEQYLSLAKQTTSTVSINTTGAVVVVTSQAKVVALGIPPGADQPNFIALIKAIRVANGADLATAKNMAEQLRNGISVQIGLYPSLEEAQLAADALSVLVKATASPAFVSFPKIPVSNPKPVEAVIDLKSAKALGQKVHGTSTGSIYHTIAISEHGVKIAARLYKSGAVSIRAEWEGAPGVLKSELEKLAEAGVSMKQGYGSVHFDAADVPLQRVIGAFLVGTGIKWQAAVMNGAELVIGEKY